ncbi:MAG TPA: SMP-30/gluconolactonase/LRE family protein [Pseudonocardiaceae bacterium]|jgi:sugar lactone lactonase YvrE|nr:SMP-30/gluconolactonase/LRE family protein [Pseudonocardiaceae bacterium]
MVQPLSNRSVRIAHANACSLGEGVAWDAADQRLYWLDIVGRSAPGLGGIVYWLSGSGAVSELGVPNTPGMLTPYLTGKPLLATDIGFETLDTTTGTLHTVTPVEAELSARRMNDGGCDPDGRVLAGTMTRTEESGQGVLYRLGADGLVHPVLTALSVPNGIVWRQPDRVHYIDSPTGRIDEYEYFPDGPFGKLIRSIDVSEYPGGPDGMTIDAEGNLWVAFWSGGAVRCISPAGALLEELRLPVKCPTSCAFGGPDLRTLYITSAYVDLGEERGELDGALLEVPDLTTGVATTAWAGPA